MDGMGHFECHLHQPLHHSTIPVLPTCGILSALLAGSIPNIPLDIQANTSWGEWCFFIYAGGSSHTEPRKMDCP